VVAGQYRKAVSEWSDAYHRLCGEHQIDFVSLTNKTPFDRALLRFLEKRGRLH
jgi:hypothetical protein